MSAHRRKHGHRHHRHHRNRRKFGMALLMGTLAVAIVVFAVGGYMEQHSKVQERGHATQAIGQRVKKEYEGVTYVEKTDIETILFMGIDKDSEYEGYGARQGGQADFLLLLVVDNDSDTIYQLQLDRDTMAEVDVLGVLGNPVGTSVMQLCLAHGFGDDSDDCAKNQVAAVERLLTDVDIDAYVALQLDSVGILNDALGGVTVTITDDFSAQDPAMVPGAQLQLNAEQAELFVRSRIDIGDGTNESRMKRQRAYMSAAVDLIRQKLSESSGFAEELLSKLGGALTSDAARGRLINIANRAYNYEIEPVETLPGEYSIGSDGFVEFRIADGAIEDWAIRVLYEPYEQNKSTLEELLS